MTIPQDPNNPLAPEKVALGKLLFHETRLGEIPKSPINLYTYSCASCHIAEAGFQSGLAQAIGEGGSGFGLYGEARIPSFLCEADSIDVQPIRAPSVMNTAYQDVVLWNGGFGATGVNANTQSSWTPGTPLEANFLGYEGLESLAIGSQEKHRIIIDTTWLAADSTYKSLFTLAFPDLPQEERISKNTAGLAIAAYERTILANQAPFQRWLKGEKKAMTADEKAGAKLFFGKAKCGGCHTGPALNSTAFYALGMSDLQNGISGVINIKPGNTESKGRGGFTGIDSDLYRFKVPQIYNLKDVKFFGHGSSFTSLTDVIKYKNNAVSQNPNVAVSRLPKKFAPLKLTDDEIGEIVNFIENALYDPSLKRYVPFSVPSGNCIPDNDTQAKFDRGCN